MKKFLITAMIFFSLYAACNAMIDTDQALFDAVDKASSDDLMAVLNNQEICNNLTGAGIFNALSRLITGGLWTAVKDSEKELSALTPANRLNMIKMILSIPSISDRMSPEQANNVFECAAHMGPSSIVKAVLDTEWILNNIKEKSARYALENHDTIDVISKDSWNLIEKDGSKVLSVMLSSQKILDFIDQPTAVKIFHNTIIHENAQSISILFAHNTMLQKAGQTEVIKCARWLGLLKNPDTVRQLIMDQNFTKYLLQEDWNNCYRCALISSDESAALLEPHTTWSCTIL